MIRTSRLSQLGIDVSHGNGFLVLRYKSKAVLVYAGIFTLCFLPVLWSAWQSGLSAFLPTVAIGGCLLLLLWTRPTKTRFEFDGQTQVFRHVTSGLFGASQNEIPFTDIDHIGIVTIPRNKPLPSYILSIKHRHGNVPVTDHTFGKSDLRIWKELGELLQRAIEDSPPGESSWVP